MERKLLEEVIAAEALGLLALPGVVGVAEGLDAGRLCIVVYVTDESAVMLPAALRGYPVVVRKSDEIRAQQAGRHGRQHSSSATETRDLAG